MATVAAASGYGSVAEIKENVTAQPNKTNSPLATNNGSRPGLARQPTAAATPKQQQQTTYTPPPPTIMIRDPLARQLWLQELGDNAMAEWKAFVAAMQKYLNNNAYGAGTVFGEPEAKILKHILGMQFYKLDML